MTKTEKILNSFLSKKFDSICKGKLLLNEHKTLNVDPSKLMENIRSEFNEVIEAFESDQDIDENFKIVWHRKLSIELADLANGCRLMFMRINGYEEKGGE